MVDLLGDRLNSGFCLKCGTYLMLPWNDYQTCSICTADIKRALAAFAYKRKRNPKVGSSKVHRAMINKQILPIGVPVTE